MIRETTLVPTLTVILFVGFTMIRPVEAQKPERQQEIQLPGIGVILKAGWQLLFDSGCRFAVPGTWHAAADEGIAFAPDGSNLSVRLLRITSWSAHKSRVKDAYGRVTVMHEDSVRRLWFEIGDKPPIQHYIDVVNGSSACVGLLEVWAATTLDAEDVNRIADSIGPAPTHWPPDLK